MVLGVMGVFTVFSFQTRAMNKELAEYPVGHLGIVRGKKGIQTKGERGKRRISKGKV